MHNPLSASKKYNMKNLKMLTCMATMLFLISSCNFDSKPNHLKALHPQIQKEIDSLEIKLTNISEETIIPGFAANIMQGNEIIFSKGFGYSDVANKHKFSPQTIHVIASVSKTFVGVAIMKLVEDKKINLDDPINDHLPFTISSPHFPESVITIKHLVTHTSSLNDDFDDGEKRPSQLIEQSIYNKDEIPKEMAGDIYYWDGTALPLEKYIKQAFTPNGKWYDDSNFSDFKPGEKYEYSNEGTNLAGLIVERVSGIPFSEFTQKHIFQPLNMTNSYWEYKDLDSTVSKLYTIYEKEGTPKVYEFPRAIDSGQPAGDLKSTGDDLSKFIIEMMNGFKGKGQILNAKSYQILLTPQMSRNIFEEHDESALNDDYDVGIFWAISKPGYRIHKGGHIGVYSIIYFNPKSDIGVVSYCNLAHPDFGKIVNTINEFQEKVEKMPADNKR